MFFFFLQFYACPKFYIFIVLDVIAVIVIGCVSVDSNVINVPLLMI